MTILESKETKNRGVYNLRAHPVVADCLALLAISTVVGVVYWAVNAPLYNPYFSIDPWLYTALWTNFHQIYHQFAESYYATRLPWIIPGYVLNQILDPRSSYFVIHCAMFFGGAAFLFLTVRHFFGRTAALATYAWVIGLQAFFSANSWDLYDGGLVFFISGGMYLALVHKDGSRRYLHLALSGFFFAAAVVTNLFVVVPLAAVPILYWFARGSRSAFSPSRRVASEAGSLVSGAIVLFVGCSVFAHLEGGPWWFVGPQISAAETINQGTWKQPYSVWLHQESRTVIPVFLIGILAVLILRNRSRLSVPPLAYGCVAYLIVVFGLYAGNEFVLGGDKLEYSNYFVLLLPGMALCFGASIDLLLAGERTLRTMPIVGVVAVTEASLLAIYLPGSGSGVGETGYVIGGAFFVFLLLYVLGSAHGKHQRARIPIALSVVLLAGMCAYPYDASKETFSWGRSQYSAMNASNYTIALRIVSYLRAVVGPIRIPDFWYQGTSEVPANASLPGVQSEKNAPNNALVGIQSLYYFEGTALGLHMPNTEGVKALYELNRPARVVLLCFERSTCQSGQRALRSLSVPVTQLGERNFRSGSESVWVDVLRGSSER